ncbi:MAG TPA: hypothetical protein VE046_11760 [Steroidobacteraceae bacterium]|nr:hypothetical protein [Steroidobacteraceae bacterium]
MLKKYALPMTLAGFCATHAVAASAADDGRWSTTIWAGALFNPGGTMQFATTGSIADLGTLDPGFADESASTSIRRLSFPDVFRGGETLGAEFAYHTGESLEPFARVSFSRLSGRRTTVGDITAEALASPAAISVNYDESNSAALTLGANYFFAESGIVQPFITGFIGADHADALHADVAVDSFGHDFDRQTVIPKNTRFVAGLQGGVSCRLGQSSDLKFSIGAEHVAADDIESTFLGPVGVSAIRIDQSPWSFPAEIGLNYRF